VSNLLPNLDALIDELSGAGAATQDARVLAEEAKTASTVDDLDEAFGRVADGWRRP
jgi:hypothetical protein